MLWPQDTKVRTRGLRKGPSSEGLQPEYHCLQSIDADMTCLLLVGHHSYSCRPTKFSYPPPPPNIPAPFSILPSLNIVGDAILIGGKLPPNNQGKRGDWAATYFGGHNTHW